MRSLDAIEVFETRRPKHDPKDVPSDSCPGLNAGALIAQDKSVTLTAI